VFYLDDGTLGGSMEDVLQDLHTVQQVAEDLGLQLNRGKLEVICVNSTTRNPCWLPLLASM